MNKSLAPVPEIGAFWGYVNKSVNISLPVCRNLNFVIKTTPARCVEAHHETLRAYCEDRPIVAEVQPTENSHWLKLSGWRFQERDEARKGPRKERKPASAGFTRGRLSLYAHEELALQWGLCTAAETPPVESCWQSIAGPWN